MADGQRRRALVDLLRSKGPPSGSLTQDELNEVVEFVDILAQDSVTWERLQECSLSELTTVKIPLGVALALKKAFPGSSSSTGGDLLLWARLQRRRGSEAKAVTEDEVHFIISSGIKGPVECVTALDHNGVYGMKRSGLAAILTSFAHQAGGGVVLVGVDSSSRPATVTGCHPYTMHEVDMVLKSHIEPRLHVDVTTFTIDSKDVIAIDVAPSRQPLAVVTADQRQLYYQRFGQETVQLAPLETVAFHNMFGGRYSSDSAAVAGADLMFSSRHMCYELGLVSDADCSDREHEMALRSCNLLDPLTQYLTRAGLLLTGVSGFQSKLPQASNFMIRAFYSSQGSCLKDIPGLRLEFDNSKMFEGPVLQQILDTAAWIQKMQLTPYSKRLEAAAADSSINQYVGYQHMQYAPEALYEVLVNAVCHRDYDKEGQAIQVWMFERAVEIVVPGTVMPGAGDLNDQPKSDLRNPSLSMLLTRAIDPRTRRRHFGGIGSGIALAKSKQQQVGGSITYDVQPSRVVVRITAMTTPRSTAGGAPAVTNAS